MRLRTILLAILNTIGLLLIAQALPASAAGASAQVPPWLQAHVGDADGQISRVVLERARAPYERKSSDGTVRNPCYFAMDATRPGDLGGGQLGRRYYIICEAKQLFRAVPSGHGAGRNLKGVVDFSNGRQCVKNFGNAQDSELTMGGGYITADTKTSFKGYYRNAARQDAILQRTFIQFDGEGETANARERLIGGHAAQVLKGMCKRKKPGSPYADRQGYVLFGKLVDYAGGRSNGCTSWSAQDAAEIIPMMKGNPTTLYIYPESRDIAAAGHGGSYWNASCLKQIGAPKFWPKKTLEPLIAQYKQDHPAPPPQPIPICTGP